MSLAARLESIRADITTLTLDAIVNAANEPLIMGGGVDGAIRTKAGPEMERELRAIGRCPAGSAVITRGHRLPARFVIHTVAPIFAGERTADNAKLASCYRSALALAAEKDIKTIAFPCIGTGIFGWPADLAAGIAFRAVTGHLLTSKLPERVTFCCFSEADRARYADMIAAIA